MALFGLSLLLPEGPSAQAERTPSRSSVAPVVIILMENHGYGQIVGNSKAKYINDTFIPAGTLYSRYYAVTHPSLPNYLALTSGSFDGCRSDLCGTNIGANNIFYQLGQHHLSWAGWASSMPKNCYRSDTSYYVHRHNPAVYYSDIYPKPCRFRDVPYPSSLPSKLPSFTFITPNICQDMHSCSVATGDAWLAAHVPPLLSRGATVIITFDEGISNIRGGGHVMTAEVGPGVTAGVRDRTRYDHFGLLAGLENYFGIRRLHLAKTHTAVPI